MSKSVRQVSRRSQVIRAQWQHHLDTQRSSGLSQAMYCREHHLNEKYFSVWKRKLRVALEPSVAPTLPTFIAVKVKPEPVTALPTKSLLPPVVDNKAHSDAVMVKAMLHNGLSIELHVAAMSLTCVLSQLSQLPC